MNKQINKIKKTHILSIKKRKTGRDNCSRSETDMLFSFHLKYNEIWGQSKFLYLPYPVLLSYSTSKTIIFQLITFSWASEHIPFKSQTQHAKHNMASLYSYSIATKATEKVVPRNGEKFRKTVDQDIIYHLSCIQGPELCHHAKQSHVRYIISHIDVEFQHNTISC